RAQGWFKIKVLSMLNRLSSAQSQSQATVYSDNIKVEKRNASLNANQRLKSLREFIKYFNEVGSLQ
ncbi:hypothetical protein, partial [Yersinia sp. 2542 StPb PI]|uniref:hypothetical protein n=1 Tax=Yersinia sp. 2542 StPb PI TaxID=3117408 RepID=UPI003B28C6DE